MTKTVDSTSFMVGNRTVCPGACGEVDDLDCMRTIVVARERQRHKESSLPTRAVGSGGTRDARLSSAGTEHTPFSQGPPMTRSR